MYPMICSEVTKDAGRDGMRENVRVAWCQAAHKVPTAKMELVEMIRVRVRDNP